MIINFFTKRLKNTCKIEKQLLLYAQQQAIKRTNEKKFKKSLDKLKLAYYNKHNIKR